MNKRTREGAGWSAAFVLLALTLPTSAVAVDGKAMYDTTCIACHGAAAQGMIPGVPDLRQGGRLAQSDAQLVANILNGFQTPGSPMAMPPKGGNPSLTAEAAQALVEYLRTLTATPSPSPANKGAPAAEPAALPSSAPAPGVSPTASDSEVAAFTRGAQVWANTCARCHAMRDPKSESDQHWKVVVTHMRLRAGIPGQQARDIASFLQGSN